MADARAIGDLTRRIEHAAILRDWLLLGALDQEVGLMLAALPPGTLAPAERTAVQRLHQVHRVVLEACEREVDNTAVKLADMRAHKDGWRAYASDDGWEGAAA